MRIIRNTRPISELCNDLRNGDMRVNKDYQRSGGLWPNNARSYFIDTILNDFPFPKVVLWQIVDLKTRRTKTEIIDGQQRLTTIRDFMDNKFKLSGVSKKFAGMSFEDLPEEIKLGFLAYEVSLDTVVSGTKEEILEIFRRINSYTLALNKSEQRYASYQGEFKWFISDLTDLFYPFIEKYKILTEREISRMDDDDMIAELCLMYYKGITSRKTSDIDNLYKDNDKEFLLKTELSLIITDTFNYIKNNLREVFERCNVERYNFYSLFGALMFNKYGFKSLDGIDDDIIRHDYFCNNIDVATESLIRLFTAASNKEFEDLDYVDFVKASRETTHSKKNRMTRFNYIYHAINQ